MPDELAQADVTEPAQGLPAPEALDEAAPADLAPDAVGDGIADDTAAGADEAPPSLDAILERDERLREQLEERLRERENAGANRREAQLKREAGKKEVTTSNVRRFLADQGYEVDDPARLHYFYDLAAANSAHELATTLPDVLMSDFKVPVEAREQAVEARERGDWNGYIGTLITGAVESKVAEKLADNERVITAEVNRRLAAEIKARGIEKAPVREGAPPAPMSSSPNSGPTPAQYRAATSAQRAAWRKQGVEPALV